MWRDVWTWFSGAGCLAGCLSVVACSRPNPAYDPTVRIGDAGVPDALALYLDAGGLDTRRADAAADLHPPADAALPIDVAPPLDGAPDRAPPAAGDAGVSSTTLSMGLIGYWDMNEATGATTAHDRSGNGNDGTLEMIDPATSWVPGHQGSALSVAGASNRACGVRVPNNAAISSLQRFTAAAWFYDTDPTTTAFRSMISRQVDGSDNEVFNLSVVRGYLKGYVPNPGGAYTVTSPQLSPHNRWAHAAFTFDGANLRLYLDGSQVAAIAYPQALPTNVTTSLYLGTNKNASNAGEAFMGQLDDLLLYSRALSAAEIQSLAAGQHP
jgi:hypothetical protein